MKSGVVQSKRLSFVVVLSLVCLQTASTQEQDTTTPAEIEAELENAIPVAISKHDLPALDEAARRLEAIYQQNQRAPTYVCQFVLGAEPGILESR
jgi:hypothetical protein